MGKPGETGLKRIFSAARYSAQGIKSCYRNEAAFRQEIAALVFMVPIALWLGEDGVERALLIGSCMLVLIVEVLNSSVEAVVDRIGHEPHELSGLAKDQGSCFDLPVLIHY
jgi:diacylglycerol kinase (ATP)